MRNRGIWPPWVHFGNVIRRHWWTAKIKHFHNSASNCHKFTISTFRLMFSRVRNINELQINMSLLFNQSPEKSKMAANYGVLSISLRSQLGPGMGCVSHPEHILQCPESCAGQTKRMGHIQHLNLKWIWMDGWRNGKNRIFHHPAFIDLQYSPLGICFESRKSLQITYK